MGGKKITPEHEYYRALLAQDKYNPDDPGEPERIMFAMGDSIIGTAGNFVVISGMPKAGKSTFISGIISSAISGRDIWGMKLFTYKGHNKYKVCIFDTEQSPYSFNKKQAHTRRLADCKRFPDYYDAYLVRERYTEQIIKQLGYYLLDNPECAIVILDGLLDFVENFNDEREAKKIVKLIRRWAKKFDVLIIAVLHQGKQTNNTLGHLGSAADRYAQSTFSVEKTKAGTITMVPKLLREAADCDTIELMYNKDVKMWVKVQ